MSQVQYYGAYYTNKGLQNLKNAFFLYLIGGIIAFVPAVSTGGVVIDFVGLIFLILSWRDLGKSSLKEAKKYEYTGKWLIRGIIIAIVLGIVASVAVTVIIISSVFSELQKLPQGNITSFNSNAATQFGQSFIGGFIAVDFLIYLIWLAVWFKMCYSIKTLSSDITQPKLRSVGNMYMIEAALGYANLVPIFLSFTSSSSFVSTTSSFKMVPYLILAPYSEVLLGGFWIVVTIVALSSAGITIYGSYRGYKSLNAALSSPEYSSQPPPPYPYPPPAYPTSRVSSKNYCKHCGTRLENPGVTTCPNCFQAT